MVPKNDLFRLVQALTPRERQAFTKAAVGTRKEPPTYLKLFRALCELESYDEATFLASRRGAGFSANFHVRKKELYEKILQVYRSQRQTGGFLKPIEFQVREYVEDARILRDKQLYDLSQQRLLHARAEAEKYQFHEVLLEILRLQRTILLDAQAPGFIAEVADLHGKIAYIAEVIQNKCRLLSLRDQLFLATRQHASLAHKLDMEVIEDVMQSIELQDVSRCLSFEATSNYYFCHALYHHLREDAQQAWVHFRALYLLWQLQTHVQRIKAVAYRNMLQNYLSLCNDAGRYADFDPALSHLLRAPFHSEVERVSALQHSLNVRLQKHLNLCEWEQARLVFQNFKDTLDETSAHIHPNRMMTFYLSFSRLFMVLGEWKDCQKWARRVIVEGGHNALEGLVLQAHLQEIIACYELGESEMLGKLKKEVFRVLGNTEGTRIERELIKWIVNHAGIVDNKGMRAKAESLLRDMEGDRSRKPSADRIIRAWLRAKLLQTTMDLLLCEERDASLAALEAL